MVSPNSGVVTAVVNYWQFGYNGLIFGADTDYDVNRIDGLDTPDVRVDVTTKAEDHGSFLFAKYLQERRIIIEGSISAGTEDFEDIIQAWKTAFSAQEEDLYLEMRFTGWPFARMIFCRPVRKYFAVEPMYSIGYARYVLELVAADPRIYGVPLRRKEVLPKSASLFGIDFPIDFDVSFGGGDTGKLIVANQGDFRTYPLITVYGPASNIRLINENTDETFRLNLTLGVGDFVAVDFNLRTIMLNDLTSRYNTLDITSVWWAIHPGNNSISFLADSTSASTRASLDWRDAWT
jgi:hypothetical protein